MTSSWVNSDSFIRVCRHLRDSRRFVGFTWTVKVDPDTVFLPKALRPRLRGHHGAGPVYFLNCPGVSDGLYGAIEVLSQSAVQAYVNNLEKCRHSLAYHNGWGEDLFAQRCMNSAGVHSDADYALVADKNCAGGLHLQGCAHGHAAYHPYKHPSDWERCWRQAVSSREQPPRPHHHWRPPPQRHHAGPGFGAPRFDSRHTASSHHHFHHFAEDQYWSRRDGRYEDEYEMDPPRQRWNK